MKTNHANRGKNRVRKSEKAAATKAGRQARRFFVYDEAELSERYYKENEFDGFGTVEEKNSAKMKKEDGQTNSA